MVCSIHELPDDIIACIFSLLTIRDAFRARLSSPRWRHLPDTRSVVKLDSRNVFGKEIEAEDQGKPAIQSKFVNIVDRFMRIWAGKKIRALIIKFVLGKEHSSHLERWIAASVRMEVEELELNFSARFSGSQQRYSLQATLSCFENAPYLKQLHLTTCTLSPLCFNQTSWLSNLTSLVLVNVPMHQRGLDFILSAGTNLTSLRLHHCYLPKYVWIDGQFLHLKKLIVSDDLFGMKLNCPSLEVFEYHGSPVSMRLVHVPVLREAKLWSTFHTDGCSVLFNHVNEQAPNVQALSLMLSTEVKPFLSTVARSSLKELEIVVTCGFDLLTVTYLLNASPCLETFQLVLLGASEITIEKREYCDRSHNRLKEVKIRGFRDQWNGMELAIYLLKNATALEQMYIGFPRHSYLRKKVKPLRQLQKTINPSLQLIMPSRRLLRK